MLLLFTISLYSNEAYSESSSPGVTVDSVSLTSSVCDSVSLASVVVSEASVDSSSTYSVNCASVNVTSVLYPVIPASTFTSASPSSLAVTFSVITNESVFSSVTLLYQFTSSHVKAKSFALPSLSASATSLLALPFTLTVNL